MTTTTKDAVALDEKSRRDFLYIAAGAFGAVGAAAAVWPFVSQMSPSADVLAQKEIEVDVTPIQVGQVVTVKWQSKPVFIWHRTPKDIKDAESVNVAELRDPQTDEQRVQKPEWLILVGICTHLGCIPVAHEGPFDGFLCHCHGSVYDTSGRIRQGPAPANLLVPPYKFLSATKVQIG